MGCRVEKRDNVCYKDIIYLLEDVGFIESEVIV